jgi:hypothetical protein
VRRKIASLIRAIEDGLYQPSMKAHAWPSSRRRRQRSRSGSRRRPEPPKIRLRPNLAGLYREQVAALEQALADPEIQVEAAAIIRSRIERITLPRAPAAGSRCFCTAIWRAFWRFARQPRANTNAPERVVYDYVDPSVPVLERMAAKRQAGYRGLGYTVEALGDGQLGAAGRSPDHRAAGGGLPLRAAIPTAAEPRAVAGEPRAERDRSDDRAVQVADADAAVVGALAVQLAADLAAEHEPRHGRRGLAAARLIVFRRGEPLKSDRHAADLDRVAVADVRDTSASPPCPSPRPSPRHHQRRPPTPRPRKASSPDFAPTG